MSTWACCDIQYDQSASECSRCGRHRTANQATIEGLFQECAQELSQIKVADFEISAASTLGAQQEESTHLLFALAREAFDDSTIENRFQESGTQSINRTVESLTAKKHLEAVEQKLHTKVFSLKKGSSLSTPQTAALLPVPANTRLRVCAFFIDLIGILILAMSVCIGISLFENQPLLIAVLQPDNPMYSVANAYVTGNLLSSVLIAFLLYPLLPALVGRRYSLGTILSGCKLYDKNLERRLPYASYFLRHTLTPVSLLLQPVLGAALFRKYGTLDLTDRLSGSWLALETEKK